MTTKIVGSGLISLDIIYEKDKLENAIYTIGGSCGNVISTLCYLDCNTYPIIIHKKNDVTYKLIEQEIHKLKINYDLIIEDDNYRIPIIIQENYKQNHKFKFKNPFKNEYLPKYKSLNDKTIDEIKNSKIIPDFFYFDRCNLSNLELVKFYKEKGTIVFFEPSKISNEKVFKECLKYSDIVKYSQDRLDNIDKYTIDKIIPVEIKTLGNKGLKFRINNNSWIEQKAKKVTNLIDSSGCGDICSTGLLYYLKDNKILSEENINRGLRIGQTMAAINCSFMGAKSFVDYIRKNDFLQLVQDSLDKETINFDNKYNSSKESKIKIEEFFLEL